MSTNYELKNRVTQLMDLTCVDLTQGEFGLWEIASFAEKKREANDFKSGDLPIEEAHMIREEALVLHGSAPTTEQFTDIASRMIANANRFEPLIGKLTGIRRKIFGEIQQLTDETRSDYNVDSRFVELMNG